MCYFEPNNVILFIAIFFLVKRGTAEAVVWPLQIMGFILQKALQKQQIERSSIMN